VGYDESCLHDLPNSLVENLTNLRNQPPASNSRPSPLLVLLPCSAFVAWEANSKPTVPRGQFRLATNNGGLSESARTPDKLPVMNLGDLFLFESESCLKLGFGCGWYCLTGLTRRYRTGECRTALPSLLPCQCHSFIRATSIEENDKVPLSLKPQRPSLRERIQAISR